MRHRDDKVLIPLLKDPATRREAFEELVEMYSSRLYWLIRRMVISHEDTNDILQDTFVQAWMNLHQFRADSKLSTWLFKIAINGALNLLNHRQELITIDHLDMDFTNYLESDPYFDGEGTAIVLQKAILSLPEKQRLIFNMRYFEDMKYEDISEILNISVGAVKSSFHIATEKIKAYIQIKY